MLVQRIFLEESPILFLVQLTKLLFINQKQTKLILQHMKQLLEITNVLVSVKNSNDLFHQLSNEIWPNLKKTTNL